MDTHLWMQGNLVGDPTQKVVASGLRVTRFRLASSGRRFDQGAGGWVNTDTVYISVTCWRQLGDNVMQSLRKGDTVLVHGRLKFREYDDAGGGPRRQSYEIEASSVGPDLCRYVTPLTRPARDLPAVPEQAAGGEAEPETAGADDPWQSGVAEPAETAA